AAHPRAGATGLGAAAASVVARAGRQVVDHAVAVVVDVVALLDGGLGRVALAERSVGAGAHALAAGRIAGLGDRLVDHAVAVVVRAVAGLGARAAPVTPRVALL